MNIGMPMGCYHQALHYTVHHLNKDHYNIHLCDKDVMAHTILHTSTLSPSNSVQVTPVNPGGQAHENEFGSLLVQVPPFLQGLSQQAVQLLSAVQESGHVQVKPPIVFVHITPPSQGG